MSHPHLREIIIEHGIESQEVQSASEKVGGDEDPGVPGAEARDGLLPGLERHIAVDDVDVHVCWSFPPVSHSRTPPPRTTVSPAPCSARTPTSAARSPRATSTETPATFPPPSRNTSGAASRGRCWRFDDPPPLAPDLAAPCEPATPRPMSHIPAGTTGGSVAEKSWRWSVAQEQAAKIASICGRKPSSKSLSPSSRISVSTLRGVSTCGITAGNRSDRRKWR